MKSPISNFIVFDTETTGLVPEKHAIVEIACCSFDIELNDGKEYDSGILKVYDNREITDGALKANGITINQLLDGGDPEQAIKRLIEYFQSLGSGKNKPVLCGHNIGRFDIPFLANMFEFFKRDLTNYINDEFIIDTMWMARVKWAESVNYKLGTCVENCGLELVDAHRAMNDTRANRNLLKHFIKSLRTDNSAGNVQEIRFRSKFEF